VCRVKLKQLVGIFDSCD